MDGFDVGTADAEPDGGDLAAIEAEWPVIAAEIDLVDAEARMAAVDDPAELDWQRLRRAEARVLRAAVEFLGRPVPRRGQVGEVA